MAWTLYSRRNFWIASPRRAESSDTSDSLFIPNRLRQYNASSPLSYFSLEIRVHFSPDLWRNFAAPNTVSTLQCNIVCLLERNSQKTFRKIGQCRLRYTSLNTPTKIAYNRFKIQQKLSTIEQNLISQIDYWNWEATFSHYAQNERKTSKKNGAWHWSRNNGSSFRTRLRWIFFPWWL